MRTPPAALAPPRTSFTTLAAGSFLIALTGLLGIQGTLMNFLIVTPDDFRAVWSLVRSNGTSATMTISFEERAPKRGSHVTLLASLSEKRAVLLSRNVLISTSLGKHSVVRIRTEDEEAVRVAKESRKAILPIEGNNLRAYKGEVLSASTPEDLADILSNGGGP
jgi:hypothetical protein